MAYDFRYRKLAESRDDDTGNILTSSDDMQGNSVENEPAKKL